MKALLKTLIVGLVLSMAERARGEGESSVLLWMVDDNLVNEVSGAVAPVPVSELLSRPDGQPVNYARVLAVKTDGSGTAPIFLDLYAYSQGERFPAGDFTDVADGYAGPLWANVTGYEDPAWSFMIELGNFSETSDSEVWTPMAYSERATYEELARFIQRGETSDPPFTPWTGGSYTVPEPTSGLLMLFGGALLALRRQRQAS